MRALVLLAWVASCSPAYAQADEQAAQFQASYDRLRASIHCAMPGSKMTLSDPSVSLAQFAALPAVWKAGIAAMNIERRKKGVPQIIAPFPCTDEQWSAMVQAYAQLTAKGNQ
jgi:hypothetical protein